ncbi:PulJ/GspJ family protein [Caldifermentibacillus hisashii]|uniref:PulJ/GspJ family protein n=1 Tax=Caldifermentibacillus hisashii TaxID=996558 RepID=UPI001595C3FD|nr:prepilin-type N-terminal cleavage/methylation domain-containing protein [Caldifermentibacillus hisashii]
MQNKFIHSNKGLTLVELLATLTILSFIGIVIYSVLFNGIRSYERTMEETKLRDEADYIMANFIDEFFYFKGE